MIQFVESKDVARKGRNAGNIHSVPIDTYIARLQTQRPDGLPPTLCEYLKSPTRTKPYFDADNYSQTPYTSTHLQQIRTQFLTDVTTVMDTMCKSILHSQTYHIVLATRHRFVPQKGQHKASFRAWVTNYAIQDYSCMGPIIQHLEESGALKKDALDKSVYKRSEQLMNSLYCCKGGKEHDYHILIPEDQNEPIESFIIQHLTGKEVDIPLDCYPGVKHNKRVKKAGLAETPESRSAARAAAAKHPIVSPEYAIASKSDICRLLHLLDKARWDRYDEWRNIATALKNATGDDTFKNLWLELSRLSPKFSNVTAENLWHSVARDDFEGSRFTIRSLECWAQHDDPVGYLGYKATTLDPFILKRWKQGDRGLAEIAHHLLKDVIKCDERCTTFYYFDNALTAWKRGRKEDLRIEVSHSLENALQLVITHLECLSGCLHTLAKRPGGAPEPNPLAPMESGPILTSSQLTDRAVEVANEKVDAIRTITYLRKTAGMTNVVTLSASLFIDPTFEQQLDSVPHLLGVRNGVVDLRTGELRERRPHDNILRILNIDYDPCVSTQLMHDTVSTIMAEDPVMTEYLQKLLGYGITGEVCEEIFAVFTSPGRSGKGVITQQLMNVLGSFYVDMHPGIIVDRNVSNVDAERAKLLGSRIAVFSELRAGEKLKTSEVQLLSGGDGIPAKPLYRDPITIVPKHLCILATNHMPQLSEVIPAIQHRLICIKFPVTFVDLVDGETPTRARRPRDDGLKTKLAADHKGILKWLVDGAVKWYAARDLKRNAPPQVKEAIAEYFKEQDTFGEFLSTYCSVVEGEKVPASELLESYRVWASENGADSRVDAKQLSSWMRLKGFEKKYTRVGNRACQCFIGLHLRHPVFSFTDGSD